MNLTRLPQTPKKDYDCFTQVGSLMFRISREIEKQRAVLTIRTASFESKITLNPRQLVGLRLLMNNYLNHLGGIDEILHSND